MHEMATVMSSQQCYWKTEGADIDSTLLAYTLIFSAWRVSDIDRLLSLDFPNKKDMCRAH